MLNITAVIAVRNEAKYLPVTLRTLAECKIGIVILDHGSTDGTEEILRSFGGDILNKVQMLYKGFFSLTDQINEKSTIIEALDTEWVIHQDADEILESPEPGESLRDGIERIASEGFSAINFNEFVFIPTRANPSYEGEDFYHSMFYYYFFEPKPIRLMRVWKKSRDIHMSEGGHLLTTKVPLVLPTRNFNLRHYIFLSKEHALQKYHQRKFSQEDLDKGWHRRRLQMPSDISLPDENSLNRLPFPESKDFSIANPWKSHFWQLKEP
ncbi:MAG: glycosyltransferase family 2 protein [Bacteroidales bacterium]|nr:glycosyltransferase family 2 protein [Bacteroidales bacterium]